MKMHHPGKSCRGNAESHPPLSSPGSTGRSTIPETAEINVKIESEILSALRRRRDHAVAAVVLGAVERGVGALEHVGDRLALAFQRGDADRDRDLDALGALVNRERLARDRAALALG